MAKDKFMVQRAGKDHPAKNIFETLFHRNGISAPPAYGVPTLAPHRVIALSVNLPLMPCPKLQY